MVAGGSATPPATVDPLFEKATETVTVRRRMCLLGILGAMRPIGGVTDEFMVSASTATFPLKADVTPYTTGVGTALVDGTLARALTIAAEQDVVVTNDLTYVVDAGDPRSGG